MILGLPLPAAAQSPARRPVMAWEEATAGSDLEEYLRVLQVAGVAPTSMVTLRPWDRRTLEMLRPADSIQHPWRALLDTAPVARRRRVAVLRPFARTIWNSSFPFGMNDGPLWAGKGVTQEVGGGVQVGWGPLTVQLAPVVFWAQNASFPLVASTTTGSGVFADPSGLVDRPQRFGNGSYARFDAGQTTVQLASGGFGIGISTANEIWGPGAVHPLVMGINAAGIPRGFFGTTRPLDVWVGRLQGRAIIGSLRATPYAPSDGTNGDRVLSGVVGSFSPRNSQIEVGAARIFERRGRTPTIGDLDRVFEGLLKGNVRGTAYEDPLRPVENQIASVFARAMLRPSLEVYAEFYRDDHAWDSRDLLVEPEHSSGTMVGVRRVWRPVDDGPMRSLLIEVVNGRPPTLQRVREQGPLQAHWALKAGHTNRGQLIGSDALFGGSGAVMSYKEWTPTGSLEFRYQRLGRSWRFAGGRDETMGPNGQDVLHAIGAGLTRISSPVEWSVLSDLLFNVNCNFDRDVFEPPRVWRRLG
ncbi:MAG: capsule assembly Wzi family protein [Gemmatimonadaceae bacterium]